MSTTTTQTYMKQSECLTKCETLFGKGIVRLTTLRDGRQAVQIRDRKIRDKFNTIAKGIGWNDAYKQAMIQAQKIIEEGWKQQWYDKMVQDYKDKLNKYEWALFEELHLQGSIQKNLVDAELEKITEADIKNGMILAIESLLKRELIKLDDDNNYTLNVPPLKQ